MESYLLVQFCLHLLLADLYFCGIFPVVLRRSNLPSQKITRWRCSQPLSSITPVMSILPTIRDDFNSYASKLLSAKDIPFTKWVDFAVLCALSNYSHAPKRRQNLTKILKIYTFLLILVTSIKRDWSWLDLWVFKVSSNVFLKITFDCHVQ